jgi:hypothetical protein
VAESSLGLDFFHCLRIKSPFQNTYAPFILSQFTDGSRHGCTTFRSRLRSRPPLFWQDTLFVWLLGWRNCWSSTRYSLILGWRQRYWETLNYNQSPRAARLFLQERCARRCLPTFNWPGRVKHAIRPLLDHPERRQSRFQSIRRLR